MLTAKESSPNWQWFLDRNGGDDTVWELEALEPRVMLDELDGALRRALDVELYNQEVELERQDAVALEAAGQGDTLARGLHD
jgi:hypothetical protein